MNILLTSAGRRSYLVSYFKQALGGEGLIYASNSEYTSALQVADEYVLTPLIYDMNYVQFLLDYAKKNNIDAILPLFDIDLPILAKSKDIFARQGIQVIVSNYEVTQICNDKWKTYQFFKEHNIATPETFLDLVSACGAIDDKEIKYPLIIKPRWGMGSIGVHSAETKEELLFFYNKTKDDVFKSYLSFESEIDHEHCVLIQEKIVGKEYSLDIINDLEANFVTTFVKRKIAMRSGETDIAVTEDNSQIFTLGQSVSKRLRHIANLDADVFMKDGKAYVLELNCRFGGGYPFSHLAGANLPLAIIKWLKNKSADDELFQVKFGILGTKEINPIILNKEHD